jgi:hypothetical protein
MTRLRLFRNLRTAAYMLVFGVLIAGAGALWWANHTGMPAAWRAAIEREFAKQGIHITIGSLSYIPLKGIVASDVSVFLDQSHKTELSRLDRIILEVDKAKLARGEKRLTKVQISDASLRLPIQPGNPETEILQINGFTGTLLMPGGRLMELRDAHGTVAGIEMTLGARLLKFLDTGAPRDDKSNNESRLKLISHILREFKNWHFDKNHPPALRVFIEGDLSNSASFVARVALQAQSVEKNGHSIDEVTAEGNLAGSLCSLSTLRATDARGVLDSRVDYDVSSREGRFDFTSTLDVPQLIKAWFGLPVPQEITFGGGQLLEAAGDFMLDEDGVPQVNMIGHARCEAVTLRGLVFDAIEGTFSLRDKDVYLRDVRITRADGAATGKMLIRWPLVQLSVNTTLPIAVYRPFFTGHTLESVLNDFGARANATVDLGLEGGFDATDATSWALIGHGRLENVTYRGVAVDSAQCNMSLNHRELDFTKGIVVFNYRDYPLRKAFGGPSAGTINAGRVRRLSAADNHDS